MDDLGKNTGIDTESFWELQGGSFRLTCKKNISSNNNPPVFRDITFGFRINEYDELELIKRFYYTPSNNYIIRRVARFGRFI